jgi:hypothetical protein
MGAAMTSANTVPKQPPEPPRTKLWASRGPVPVDVYVSPCDICWAWVDDTRAEKHARWHRRNGDM